MPADRELFEPAAILASIRLGAEPDGGISAERQMEIFDKMYDCLDSYSREKNPRERFKITQTFPDVNYDV